MSFPLILVLLVLSSQFFFISSANLKDNRPPPNQRKFRSKVIDDEITSVASKMKDPYLALLFTNCFPNTLDTTVEYTETTFNGTTNYDTFIITGDIEAMWFRDSANQVLPYVPYVTKDPSLKNMIKGVINRQTDNILYDPYANSFNKNNEGSDHQATDSTHKLGFLNSQIPAMTPHIFERKYELDSILAVIKLAYAYWNTTNDSQQFNNDKWKNAMRSIMDVIEKMQKSPDDGPAPYFFVRQTTTPTDTLMNGIGGPALVTGMSRSPFRPSDDATTFPFLIPANAMAVVQLNQLSQMFYAFNEKADGDRASDLSSQIKQGIQKYATVNHPVFGNIYAYETDGFGNFYSMDDANIPSLLSFPYLGFISASDPLYQNTRKFLFSANNPYYAKGSAGEGIGGPHVGRGWIWPMSIIMRALTTNDDNEIVYCLNLLKSTDAGTGFMHESFWKDNAGAYTRPWFAWANSLYGELILTLARTKPHLIFK